MWNFMQNWLYDDYWKLWDILAFSTQKNIEAPFMSLMRDVLQAVAVVQIGITQWIFGEVKMALIR